MSYNRLFILVEGDDDERFFASVLVPRFKEIYDHVQVWQYARQPTGKVESFLRSIRGMGADYLYVADMDNAPCVTQKKEGTMQRISGLAPGRIAVVIAEIESWYYAGIDSQRANRLNVPNLPTTGDVTKRRMEQLIKDSFDSRIDFMSEVLKTFSISTARAKNPSFCHFLRTLLC